MLSRSSTAWLNTRVTDSAIERSPFGWGGSLSATIGPRRAFPTGSGQVGGESPLSRGGGSDLLGGDRNRAAALGDVLDGEHHLVGGSALLLAGEVDLAAHLGHRPHHGQPSRHLLDA